MRTLRTVGIITLVFVVGVILLAARFWWATLTPSVPRHWPPGSVWIPAPPAPLDWSPRGNFAGCRLDDSTNADLCRFADYTGHVWYEGEYVNCVRRAPVPPDRLKIKPQADWIWLKSQHLEVPRVHLEDGTELIPVSACEAAETRSGKAGLDPE